jgi:hypothetical protein
MVGTARREKACRVRQEHTVSHVNSTVRPVRSFMQTLLPDESRRYSSPGNRFEAMGMRADPRGATSAPGLATAAVPNPPPRRSLLQVHICARAHTQQAPVFAAVAYYYYRGAVCAACQARGCEARDSPALNPPPIPCLATRTHARARTHTHTTLPSTAAAVAGGMPCCRC